MGMKKGSETTLRSIWISLTDANHCLESRVPIRGPLFAGTIKLSGGEAVRCSAWLDGL